MKARPGRLLSALLMLALLAGGTSFAQGTRGERQKQKQAAEQERSELKNRLAGLRRDIERTESARSHASDALANSERAISESRRALAELAQEQQETAARLDQLQRQKRTLEANITERKAQLARLAREQYVTGGADRSRLLLSGENPNRISRDLHYLGYVSRAQAALVAKLQADLDAVEDTTEQAQAVQEELDDIAEDQRKQMVVLEKEKSRRATLLAQLSTRLDAQRREAGNLQRDEQRLASLVDRLGKLLEEQRKAELAQAKRRREAEEKRLAERKQREEKRKSADSRRPAESFKAEPIDDDPPPKQAQQAQPARPPEPGPSTDMLALRGQLKMPIRGELVARFGSRRGEGGSWKGLFIKAPEGSEVRAVAAGRVAYAEWLRGFGNLVIVDHGNQYLSIYGNNQAVLKRPGDNVKAGEVLASAGNSGGNEFSGLYFELRHQGRPIDPLQWVSSR